METVQPFLDAGVTLIWHCDGNLSQMVPRLLDCGLKGFQGFQYEDGIPSGPRAGILTIRSNPVGSFPPGRVHARPTAG